MFTQGEGIAAARSLLQFRDEPKSKLTQYHTPKPQNSKLKTQNSKTGCENKCFHSRFLFVRPPQASSFLMMCRGQMPVQCPHWVHLLVSMVAMKFSTWMASAGHSRWHFMQPIQPVLQIFMT